MTMTDNVWECMRMYENDWQWLTMTDNVWECIWIFEPVTLWMVGLYNHSLANQIKTKLQDNLI